MVVNVIQNSPQDNICYECNSKLITGDCLKMYGGVIIELVNGINVRNAIKNSSQEIGWKCMDTWRKS